jgi:uncharacterized repeat protein (TIGR03803 family)
MAFKLTTNGVFTALASFGDTNGVAPSSLLLGLDGNFYGTTTSGGSAGHGTAFRLTTNGDLVTLLSFDTNVNVNIHLLARGHMGELYGATSGNPIRSTGGSVFRLTTNGNLTTLVTLPDFGNHRLEALVLGNDGCLYAAGPQWGADCGYGCGYPLGFGNILKITMKGELTTLFTFYGTNGAGPNGLVMGSDGNLYGTTAFGGSTWVNRTNSVFDDIENGLGTVFKLTTEGVLTTLVSFDGGNGSSPVNGSLFESEGTFYGTFDGGVFRVTPDGALTALANLDGLIGEFPQVLFGDDGNLYGTTEYGGASGGGTFFRIVIPRITSLAKQPSGGVLLSGSGPANGSFSLWATTNVLLPSSWATVASNTFDSSGHFSYTDARATTNNALFYRLSVP